MIYPEQWPRVLQAANAGPGEPHEHLFADEWAQGLAGLGAAEIAAGIERARAHCTWPPNIAQFRKLATDSASAEQRAFAARLAQADAESAKALPAETWAERQERVRGHLAVLKASLRQQRREPSA